MAIYTDNSDDAMAMGFESALFSLLCLNEPHIAAPDHSGGQPTGRIGTRVDCDPADRGGSLQHNRMPMHHPQPVTAGAFGKILVPPQ